MLFRRKQANYHYVPEESVIRLVTGGSGTVDRLEVRSNGDTIYYRGDNRTHFFTFEIADYDSHSDSRVHGLPSGDRLRGFDKAALATLAQITGIPLAELVEIRDLETAANVAPPTWQ